MLNLITVMFFLLVMAYILDDLISIAIVEKNKFKLYALRDQLALCAMEKKIKQESEEYKFLLNYINNQIKFYEKNITLIAFWKSLNKIAKNKNEHINAILKNLLHNKDVSPIVEKSFKLYITKQSRRIKFYCVLIGAYLNLRYGGFYKKYGFEWRGIK